MLHQVFEQAKLARLQIDLLAAANHAARQAIELEIADAIAGLFGGTRPTPREHLDASEQLVEAGYTPLAQPGAAGWPLTRLMGLYIFREVGPDAMEKVRDGEAKLTDEG